MRDINFNRKLNKTYIWNTFAGILNSFQLFLLLLVVSRTNKLGDSGILSSAYGLGNLFMSIGKFGMRNFQVSDATNKYSHSTYYTSRIITNGVMIFAFAGYGLLLFFDGSYSWNKLLVMLIICSLKAIDSHEDVLHGILQHDDHFDIASKAMAIRLFVSIVLQGIMLSITHDLIISFGTSLLVSLLLYFVLTSRLISKKIKCVRGNGKEAIKLIWECLPLGLSNFTIMYIANFPKYAVDAYTQNEVQACFNYAFMPVFVINLLSSFVFQPILAKISIIWEQGENSKFIRVIGKPFFIIIGIILAAVTVGYMIGIPVLSLVFNLQLEDYKKEFMVLLISGGFLSIQTLCSLILTVMRAQKYILSVNIIALVIAMIFQKMIILQYGTIGISFFYMGILALLAILQFIYIFIIIAKRKNK